MTWKPRASPITAVLGIAGAALLGGTGCTERAGSAGPGDAARSVPQYGGEFHLMLEAPRTLDPGFVDDVYEACVVNQIYDGLLEYDVSLNPIPAIAREWSVSRDGTVYEFTLRRDVRFHNGRLVTAPDFVYSFTRLFDPDRDDYGLGGEYLCKIAGVSAYRSGEADRIAGLTAAADFTLRIELETPYASFLSALAMDQTKVVAREEIERWGDDYDGHPCGTGPFVFDRRDGDESDPRIHLRANLDHFRGRPYLDELVFHVPKDFNADLSAAELLAGKLTMADMPGALNDRFVSDPRFRVIRKPELSFSFLGLNARAGRLQDVRVRKAVAHAVNRDRVLELDPVGRIPAEGILPPGMFGYSPEPKVVPHDPGAARRLLAEAGHPGGEGLPPIEYWQAARGEVGRKADRLLEEDLAAVGIDIVFRYVEWDEFDRRLDEVSVPAFGLTWVGDVPDPDSFLTSLFLSEGAYNMFAYASPAVDSLLTVGSAMRSSRDRADVYRRAERIILEEAAVVPLFHLANNFAVRSNVRGLLVTPFGLGNLTMERVWLGDAPAG